MMCEQFTDLYELYAAGVLGGDERLALENHLADGCPVCKAGIEKANALNEMILIAVPRVQPSADVRRRVLASFANRGREKRRTWSFAFALAAAAALVLVFASLWNAERRAHSQDSGELARLREIEQILQSPATKQVSFGPEQTQPHGTIFVNEQSGMILIASGLPAAPQGFTYESWVVPKDGAPKPVEPFAVRDGRGISLLRTALPMSDLKAVAVSLEPLNVPVTKPTKVIFAAPLG